MRNINSFYLLQEDGLEVECETTKEVCKQFVLGDEVYVFWLGKWGRFRRAERLAKTAFTPAVD